MDRNTPSLNSVFATNARVGTQGNGDERAFASFVRSLNHSANSDFRRSNAFLSIIIVSDEEDFSSTNSTFSESYTNPNLRPVSYFVNWLDTFTGSTSANRNQNYQVNAIYIRDAACLSQLGDSSQKISTRYGEIADTTGGTKSSLCDSFSSVLNNITNSILGAAAVFQLERTPIENSIVVRVDGASVPAGSTTWQYESATNIVRFASSYAQTLNANSSISITYDPTTLL